MAVFFPVYAIDRDNGNGHLVRRASFARIAGNVNRANDRNLVTHCDTDGGIIGTIAAPDGSALGEIGSGDAALILPDGRSLSAQDAMDAARHQWPGYDLAIVGQ